MNSKEQVVDILKCNHPTPHMVRSWIDEFLNEFHNDGAFHTDWETIKTDNSLYSVRVKQNHFFQIYVFYNMDQECTLVVIKFKEESYAQKIGQHHVLNGVDNYVIYCDNMDKSEFLGEFEHIYVEFYRFCLRTEYMEEFPDD